MPFRSISVARRRGPPPDPDEWAIAERRYLSEGSMARLDPAPDDELTKEVERAKTVLLAS
jgi:hypothetical protein